MFLMRPDAKGLDEADDRLIGHMAMLAKWP